MGRKKPSGRGGDGEQRPADSQGGVKSKKKAVVIDDDEYSIGTEVTEEPQVEEENIVITGKKKGKKGNKKGPQREDDDDIADKVGEEEEDVPEIAFAGKKKSKSKKGGGATGFTSSSFGLLDEEEEEENDLKGSEGDEPATSFVSERQTSKKGKKGGSSFTASAFDALGDGDDVNDEDTDMDNLVESHSHSDAEAVAFTWKKSSEVGKKSGSVFSQSNFDGLNEDEDNEEVHGGEEGDESAITFSGKKKRASKKGKKSGNSVTASAFDALGGDDDDEDEVMDKSVKSKIELEELPKDDEEDASVITFSGKKKKSSKSSKKIGNSFSAAVLDGENDSEISTSRVGDDNIEDGDTSEITFSGRKKSSKKKGSSVFATLSNESVLGGIVDETKHEEVDTETSKDENNDSKANKSKETVDISKSKKKKKNKSGRTDQEEDDLDKILAELGEGPAASKPAAPSQEEEKAQAQHEPVTAAVASCEKEGEEETVESAAAKKKKKKKEKEKEKKAAAAAAAADVSLEAKEEKQQESVTEPSQPKKKDAKSKAAEKKIPKHVREMQEALARRQEAEERKKREEEEKLRKEEEERRRQEEHERQAEEARRRKKEREKEKLLQKKKEGKLLTAKQKEEAQRREAFKNRLMASAGGLPIPDKEGAPTKRPIYGTKKKPARQKTNGTASIQAEGDTGPKEEKAEEPETLELVDSAVTERVEAAEELANVEEESEVADVALDNGVEEDDDDEDDWDAKSWDDLKLNIRGAFEDEEADSKAQPAVKKELKSNAPKARDLAPPTATKPAVAAEPTLTAGKAATSQPDKGVENRKSQPETEDTAHRKDTTTKSKTSDDVGKQGDAENLRSPICCIMGHVDTGKTKLLDCIRGTNVQEGEAGGITQQIGATYFPAHNIRERTKELKADAKLKVPGLLVIDTPGHESFTNLRSRGSGLCDIAILVVDIMHGLEPQTIESLNLLKMRDTEFIVALNKVDRLYNWKTCHNAPIGKAMKQQSKDVISEFNMRVTQVKTQFMEQGLNTELYYKNKEMGQTYSIVPTSAISGEGIPDLLLLLVQWAQKTMVEKLTYINKVQCTVLEVKVIEGHGTTIDVVLVNGVLHEGDQIVVCGLQGPIVTTIRALLTPHPMKELRVKGAYLHHKEIKAAMGIKITAQGLETAIAGTGLYVVGPDDDLEDVKESAMEDMRSVMSRIDKSGEGVYVQASTLGSLEALLEFLKSPDVKIPVSGIGIGPVHKKDIMKASTMLERRKEFATILAFDVKVTAEARELADEMGVKIFCADIIYHLFDQFKAYIDNIKEEKKNEAAEEAVFPCVLKILPNCVFNKRDPIVLGVNVVEGLVKIGTPICIPQREFIGIGRVASIQINYKPVDFAKKGQTVAIKIVGSNPEEQQKMFGRHFEMEDELVSHISRRSIDILKANYRDELSIEEWKLVVKLKSIFRIQ